MPCEIRDNTKWKNTQRHQEFETNNHERKSKKGTMSMHRFSAKELLNGMRMSPEEKERAIKMSFLIPDLVPRGYHIVIYGAAGSGKTTIMLHLCTEMLKKNPEVEVYYLYLDGQLGMAAGYENYIDGLGLLERYNILINGHMEEMLSAIELSVHNEECKAVNIVVVLDTLKYLNPNINNKDANVKMMQRIKKLTSKGMTVISLHHTNKDGQNFSGTAEIEQDGDAILKIETVKGEDKHTRISTIKEGGRVRFHMKDRSFGFVQGKPESVEELEAIVDSEKLKKQEKDVVAISIIKGVLNLKGEIAKSDLENYLKEDDGFECSERERKRILSDYVGIHWKVRKSGERNHIHLYSVIDRTPDLVARLNQKIRE